MVKTKKLELKTKGECHMIDITGDVALFVGESGVESGMVNIFVPGATGGVTAIEYEPGLEKDFAEMMERLIPSKSNYTHNEQWADGNGHSHLRASLLGPSLCVPILAFRLALGEWQQIVVLDFDVKPREREIIIQIVGE